jgi:hypothetical protein
MQQFPAGTSPAFLSADQETELEYLPLQVLLLTQEVALHRARLNAMAEGLKSLASMLALPTGNPVDFVMGTHERNNSGGPEQ